MLLRRLSAHVRGENWFAVVLDLLVVVVGLFIGLQLDTWWEEQKDVQLESAYLLEIREDFEANKSSLQDQIRVALRAVRVGEGRELGLNVAGSALGRAGLLYAIRRATAEHPRQKDPRDIQVAPVVEVEDRVLRVRGPTLPAFVVR